MPVQLRRRDVERLELGVEDEGVGVVIIIMNHHLSIKKLSGSILSFDNWSSPWEFENYISQNIIDPEVEILFKKIWSKAMEPENWNYSDLNIGTQKTIIILKDNFELDENTAHQIARAAAYQWK